MLPPERENGEKGAKTAKIYEITPIYDGSDSIDIVYLAHNRALCASNIFSDHLYRQAHLSAVGRDYEARRKSPQKFSPQSNIPEQLLEYNI